MLVRAGLLIANVSVPIALIRLLLSFRFSWRRKTGLIFWMPTDKKLVGKILVCTLGNVSRNRPTSNTYRPLRGIVMTPVQQYASVLLFLFFGACPAVIAHRSVAVIPGI